MRYRIADLRMDIDIKQMRKHHVQDQNIKVELPKYI